MPRGRRLVASIGIPVHPETVDTRFFATYLPGGDANNDERIMGPYRSINAAREEALAVCPMGAIRLWQMAVAAVE